MSLQPQGVLPPVPEQTALVARAAFPRSNPYLRLRDQFGIFYSDEDFLDLYPRRGQPAFSPWRLALVTGFQFAETCRTACWNCSANGGCSRPAASSAQTPPMCSRRSG